MSSEDSDIVLPLDKERNIATLHKTFPPELKLQRSGNNWDDCNFELTMKPDDQVLSCYSERDIPEPKTKAAGKTVMVYVPPFEGIYSFNNNKYLEVNHVKQKYARAISSV